MVCGIECQVMWSPEATVGLCFLVRVTQESIGRFEQGDDVIQSSVQQDGSGSFVRIS